MNEGNEMKELSYRLYKSLRETLGLMDFIGDEYIELPERYIKYKNEVRGLIFSIDGQTDSYFKRYELENNDTLIQSHLPMAE